MVFGNHSKSNLDLTMYISVTINRPEDFRYLHCVKSMHYTYAELRGVTDRLISGPSLFRPSIKKAKRMVSHQHSPGYSLSILPGTNPSDFQTFLPIIHLRKEPDSGEQRHTLDLGIH